MESKDKKKLIDLLEDFKDLSMAMVTDNREGFDDEDYARIKGKIISEHGSKYLPLCIRKNDRGKGLVSESRKMKTYKERRDWLREDFDIVIDDIKSVE